MTKTILNEDNVSYFKINNGESIIAFYKKADDIPGLDSGSLALFYPFIYKDIYSFDDDTGLDKIEAVQLTPWIHCSHNQPVIMNQFHFLCMVDPDEEDKQNYLALVQDFKKDQAQRQASIQPSNVSFNAGMNPDLEDLDDYDGPSVIVDNEDIEPKKSKAPISVVYDSDLDDDEQ